MARYVKIYNQIKNRQLSYADLIDYEHIILKVSFYNRLDIIENLKENGIINDRTLLIGCCLGGHKHILDTITKTSEDLDNALLFAAIGNQKALIKYILKLGVCDINNVLIGASMGGHTKLYKYALANYANKFNQALYFAAKYSNKNIIELIMNQQVDIKYGLIGAYDGGDTDLIEYFNDKCERNSQSYSILLCSNNINIVKHLIKTETCDINNTIKKALIYELWDLIKLFISDIANNRVYYVNFAFNNSTVAVLEYLISELKLDNKTILEHLNSNVTNYTVLKHFTNNGFVIKNICKDTSRILLNDNVNPAYLIGVKKYIKIYSDRLEKLQKTNLFYAEIYELINSYIGY